jgi:glycine/D-amino acid oxidase-like deaminating enzyme/nitrite reductase/ring-hydroxylating ferredoxin subunit
MNIKSIWEGTSSEITEYSSLQGDHKADVVIVGGGITGLTAAMLLSNAGKEVILLESKRIGLGTTGNSTGNLYSTVDEHLSSIKKKWNSDVMKTIVNSRAAAINLIENTIGKYNIDCDFYRTSFNYFVENSTNEIDDFLKEEEDAIGEAGLIPQVRTNPGLPFDVQKSLSVGGQAQFHPLKYCRALAKVLSQKCKIYENSQVMDYDDDEGIVKTVSGTITAEHILMATHTPKGVHFIHTKLAPYREHGVAAELKSGTCPQGIFWGLDQPKHSIRSLKSNGKEYVMVVGDKFKVGQNEDHLPYIHRLEAFLGSHFQINPIKYTWGGQHYRSADSLPYIGKHGDHIYFLTGFATDGLVYGTLGAMIVADQVLGKENEYEKTYKSDRSAPLKSAKDFIKENTNVMMQYVKDIPYKAEVEAFMDILPGDGKMIEFEGEKYGAYRDRDGKLHVVSAVCTHMKCIVSWNNGEQTWDCPCHGSRFDYKGKVLEGPALTDLGKMGEAGEQGVSG